MSDDSRQPWEQQPGETPRQYGAFCLFRDLKPFERSLGAVAGNTIAGKKNLSSIQKWSSTYHWADRALAWDGHLDEIVRDETEQQRKVAAQERLDTGRLAVKFAYKWLAKNYNNAEDQPAGPIATIMKTGADMSRLEEGQSTEQVDGSIIVKVLRGVSMDDL